MKNLLHTIEQDIEFFKSLKMEIISTIISHADFSPCIRLKVGCKIIEYDDSTKKFIDLAGGYNRSFNYHNPKVKEDLTCECKNEKGELVSKADTIHAEIDALGKLSTNYYMRHNHIMIITHSPCFNCALAIVTHFIPTVIYINEYRDTTPLKKLHEGGVKIYRAIVDKKYLDNPMLNVVQLVKTMKIEQVNP